MFVCVYVAFEAFLEEFMKRFFRVVAILTAMTLPLTALADDHSSRRSSKNRKPSKPAETIATQPAVQSDSRTDASDSTSSSSMGSTRTTMGVTFSDTQRDLLYRATSEFKSENFKQAESLLETIIYINEFDLMWFQLGKAYDRENKCMDAYNAFGRVAAAPSMPKDVGDEIPKDQLINLTKDAVATLNDKCTAKVRFVCDPPEMDLSVDGGMEFKCSDEVRPFTVGRHAIYARTSFGFSNMAMNVTDRAEGHRIEVKVIDWRGEESLEELERKSTLYNSIGWSLLGAGVVGASVSAGLMWYFNDDYQKQYDNYNAGKGSEGLKSEQESTNKKLIGTYAGLGIGGAMVVTGAALLIVNAVSITPRLENLKRDLGYMDFMPVMSPEFTGFTLSGMF